WRLRLGIGNRKRMPENHTLHVARSTLQEKCECLRAIGRIERETELGSEPGGRLSLRGRMTVTPPQAIHHFGGAGSGERDPKACEQPSGRASEAHRTPAIRDQPWRHADADDMRRPAERGDGEREARGRTAGAER